ncbi:HD domain-containing protein [Williamsia sp. CHRR-6]|uniref:HD domain-containing protein n=1 Tax=Williamsia sp. CHRR-6 TaxID=2835871 RepID=UPI001BDB23E8|nr:HD domain-containing protein [Williamsia sp. CHRR-6]MBT0567226.1 HD domain-containing protein [Williamsia sp. CHRR-6]
MGDAGTSLVAIADGIAAQAHRGQTDKLGVDYIEHPRAVSRRVDQSDEHLVAAALLHDVIEDSEFTAIDLLARGIPQQVIDTVALVTRDKQQSPDDYYALIRTHPAALAVKLADLGENTDPSRLSRLPLELQQKLMTKYTKAFRALGRDDLADELATRTPLPPES